MFRHARAISAVMAVAAVAVSMPATGLADNGGRPHSTRPCPMQSHSGKHKGALQGKAKGALKGKKCGLR
jgi:hypothetical protein